MFRPIIFGGTAEGRMLAEYCSEKNIDADISVTTELGARVLPDNINVLCGKLECAEMINIFRRENYTEVFDATHPYAENVSKNLADACKTTDIPYYRLVRSRNEIVGESVSSLSDMINELNDTNDIILSTLGGNSAEKLTAVNDFRERIWLRVLPSDEIINKIISLGFDENKIISERGPFDIERNIGHIKQSGAGILITKESGKTGGYPEKCEAAKICGIRMITLERPRENGYSYDEIISIIERKNLQK